MHHDTQLVCYPFCHIKPMEFIVQKGRETMIVLLRVTDHAGSSVEHSLQLIGVCIGRPCIDCIAVVDASCHKSVHELVLNTADVLSSDLRMRHMWLRSQ